MCDKGFIWNPSNCECECDKSCHIGEYLDLDFNNKCMHLLCFYLFSLVFKKR